LVVLAACAAPWEIDEGVLKDARRDVPENNLRVLADLELDVDGFAE
jgi:hypothetical protein